MWAGALPAKLAAGPAAALATVPSTGRKVEIDDVELLTAHFAGGGFISNETIGAIANQLKMRKRYTTIQRIMMSGWLWSLTSMYWVTAGVFERNYTFRYRAVSGDDGPNTAHLGGGSITVRPTEPYNRNRQE
jgi:hypothetical protein